MPDDIMPTKIVSFASDDESPSTERPTPPPPPPAAPGGPIEVAFSFDTTGSMSGCINGVKAKVQEVITRLFSDIPALRIAVLAHGDYCDRATSYVTKFVDFSTNQKELCEFVRSVGGTGGGDFEECYELALRQVREELSWTPGTQRSLVMIGDAIPHPPSYAMNTDNIDWKAETKRLYSELGVHIYAVACGSEKRSDKFFDDLASMTHGKLLKLDNFTTIIDLIMAVCYREHGPDFYEAYEREVRAREGRSLRPDLDRMLVDLRERDHDTTSTTSSGVGPSRNKTRARKSPYAKKTSKPRKTAPGVVIVGKARDATKVKKPAKLKKMRSTKSDHKDGLRGVSKMSKRIKKSTAPTRVLRENTTKATFQLNSMKWSPWRVAMATKPLDGEEDKWMPRRNGECGYRKFTLFGNDTRHPAIYEFAVQPVDNAKKYTVYQRITNGFTENLHWDTYLLRHQNVIAQLSDVISNGCTVHVRRAIVKEQFKIGKTKIENTSDLRKYLTRRYDYAWNKFMYGKRRHRKIIKRGHMISNSDY